MIKRYDMNNFDITWKIKIQVLEDKDSNRHLKSPDEFTAEERDASKNYIIDHEDFVALIDRKENLFIYMDGDRQSTLERIIKNITETGIRSMKLLLNYRS